MLSAQDFDKLVAQLSSVVLEEPYKKKPASRRKTPLQKEKAEATQILYSVSAVQRRPPSPSKKAKVSTLPKELTEIAIPKRSKKAQKP